ncbi:MAG: pyruvate ferredoxin oxidoreductase, partial [Candidatus Moranbacteria bacterium]|nr:pyruvate ferredoxin oxidoreductase [Candidatus Moranbacteria bacterium]
NENQKNIEEYLKTQKRFKHLFQVGNEDVLKSIQEGVDRKWEELLKKVE